MSDILGAPPAPMPSPAPSEAPLNARDAAAAMSTPATPRDQQGRFARAATDDQQQLPPVDVQPPPGNEPSPPVDEDLDLPPMGEETIEGTGWDDEDPVIVDDDTPPVEAPRSWTAAEKAEFSKLPPPVQASIAERERKRDLDIRTSQNEAAKLRQDADAVRSEANALRSQYEEALPKLLDHLNKVQAGEFADIQSWDDVQRMAAQEPIRYMKWQAQQQQMAAVQAQVEQAKAREAQEYQARLQAFRAAENARFLEKAPEFADATKLPSLQKAVHEMLNDVGVPDEELALLYQGDGMISLHDHRTQLILRDAMRYRAARAKAAQPTARKQPVTNPPPVQRPGVATSRAEVRSARVSDLEQQLQKSGNRADAVALLRARRQR